MTASTMILNTKCSDMQTPVTEHNELVDVIKMRETLQKIDNAFETRLISCFDRVSVKKQKEVVSLRKLIKQTLLMSFRNCDNPRFKRGWDVITEWNKLGVNHLEDGEDIAEMLDWFLSPTEQENKM